MSSTKKFFKSSMVYFMGNVLTKIISFFLLPLYTTRISTDEYGYFNTSTNYPVSYTHLTLPTKA